MSFRKLVILSQVKSIQDAIREKKPRFEFMNQVQFLGSAVPLAVL